LTTATPLGPHKIHGKPIADSILKLTREIKPTHVPLFGPWRRPTWGPIFSLDYRTIQRDLKHTFRRPAHRGPLILPDDATQALIRERKDIRNDKLRLFKEVNQ